MEGPPERSKPSASPPRPRQRGTYKKSEVSRRQVIEAAIRALAERGFVRTSIQDIAAAAGMSKGAVHYHFESKDDLIGQVLELCAEAMATRARTAWDTPGEPREKLRRALRELWSLRRDGNAELRVLVDLMAQSVHDTRLRKPIAAMMKSLRADVGDQVRRTLDGFGVQPRVPVQLVPRLLLATLDGLALHHHFDPPAEAEEEEVLRSLEAAAFLLFDL